MLSAIVDRLKVLAKIDLADRSAHQSGTLELTVGDQAVVAKVHIIQNDDTPAVLIEMDAATGGGVQPEITRQWLAEFSPA